MVDADSRLIEWLFHESGISRYKISKDIGVSESTLSRIAKGHTPMDAVKFGLAQKLTAYARSIQSPPSTSEDAPEEPGDREPTSKGEDET